MRRLIATVLLVLALGAAGATAAAVLLFLPEPGTVRFEADDPRSELSQLEASIDELDIDASRRQLIAGSLVEGGGDVSTFRAASYWTDASVAARRNTYLGAGALVVLALLGAATAVAMWRWPPKTEHAV